MPNYLELPDEQLLILVKKDDRKAFDEVYNRLGGDLFKFAFHILNNVEECTDAIQDIFLWFWQNREKLETTNLKRYLFAAVKYKLVRIIQNSKRRSEILAASPELTAEQAHENLEIKELQNLIDQFISNLPPKAREIFTLSRVHYLTNKEIAARLNISEKTVENQMTISLKKLRAALGKMQFWIMLI